MVTVGDSSLVGWALPAAHKKDYRVITSDSYVGGGAFGG
jgi:hypothetical protein